jgi:hypothetical protein
MGALSARVIVNLKAVLHSLGVSGTLNWRLHFAKRSKPSRS